MTTIIENNNTIIKNNYGLEQESVLNENLKQFGICFTDEKYNHKNVEEFKTKEIIDNQTFDEERALYGKKNILVRQCKLDGPADGESAFKECQDIVVEDTYFNLRYPFWHDKNVEIIRADMTENCRASLWYDENVTIKDSNLGGIKALRECRNVKLLNSNADSIEFSWFCHHMKIDKFKVKSQYAFLQCTNMDINELDMESKYSFQYVQNVTIRNSELKTKDAFWHGKNITVIDSVIRGEYLAWYAENIKFIRCKIIGTQPFCYTKGLVLEDCEMIDADFAFENSEVEADLHGELISIKNPIRGKIVVDKIGEIIINEFSWAKDSEDKCEIIERTKL